MHTLSPLLLHHSPAAGWSLVLPGGWVLPFWLALVFQGAKAIGQREWRWLHTLQGLPFFPHDFPDTKVGQGVFSLCKGCFLAHQEAKASSALNI